MVELGQGELITMRSRKGLDILNLRIDHILGTSIAPLAPVTGGVTCGKQGVAHENIVGTHRLLGIVRIIAVRKGMTLMKSRLLG